MTANRQDKQSGKTNRPPACKHCGAPIPENTPAASADFCCAGCAAVHRLINEHGLASFYELKDQITPPATTALLPERDYTWLADAQAAAERDALAHNRAATLTLDVQGISCAACVWLIERLHDKQPGSGRIEINAPAGQLRLTWSPPAPQPEIPNPNPQIPNKSQNNPPARQRPIENRESKIENPPIPHSAFRIPHFAAALQSYNYLLAPASAERTAPPESRGLVRRIGLCAAFAMNTMLFTLPLYFGMDAAFEYERLFITLSMIFGTLSLLVGGGYFISRAARALAAGVAHIDLPIALGLIGSYAASFFGWLANDPAYIYFDFVSTFSLLMLIGRWAQTAAVERNRRRLLARQPAPPRVRTWDNTGTPGETSPENLRAGQRYALGPGQVVPVDSRLETGTASMNLAWINGEPEPRAYRAGQIIPSGALSLARAETRLRAVQGWPDSLLARLMRPASRPSARNLFFERVIQGYLFAIIVISAVAGIAWWISTHDALRSGAIAAAVLVVSCPCAIGLALPLADEAAAVALRRRGVFVRVPDLWPRIAKIRRIVFDKTGTLTLETPVPLNPDALDTLASDARRALLALTQNNRHPVARALHEAIILRRWDDIPLAGEPRESIGHGVSLGEWELGKAPGENSDLVLSREGNTVAHFHFADLPRANARAELDALRARALDITILSGDRPEKVAAFAAPLGLSATEALGGLTPQAKAEWLSGRANPQGEPHAAVAQPEASPYPANTPETPTLMLGDGANDSLAFDAALCRGTPAIHNGILAEKADFYYLGHDISGIRALFETDALRRRTHGWLLAFAISYNIAAIAFAATGHIDPLVAAIIMPFSSLATLVFVALGMRRAF